MKAPTRDPQKKRTGRSTAALTGCIFEKKNHFLRSLAFSCSSGLRSVRCPISTPSGSIVLPPHPQPTHSRAENQDFEAGGTRRYRVTDVDVPPASSCPQKHEHRTKAFFPLNSRHRTTDHDVTAFLSVLSRLEDKRDEGQYRSWKKTKKCWGEKKKQNWLLNIQSFEMKSKALSAALAVLFSLWFSTEEDSGGDTTFKYTRRFS